MTEVDNDSFVSNEHLVRTFCEMGIPYQQAAIEVGVSKSTAYNYDMARRQGFGSYSEYKDFLAGKNLDKTGREYQKKILARVRNRRKMLPVILRNRVKKSLLDLNQNVVWLTKESGISRGSIENWLKWSHVPENHKLEKVFKALGLPYKTLEDLLKEGNVCEILSVDVDKKFVSDIKKIKKQIFDSYGNPVEIYNPKAASRTSMANECNLCDKVVMQNDKIKHYVLEHMPRYLFS